MKAGNVKKAALLALLIPLTLFEVYLCTAFLPERWQRTIDETVWGSNGKDARVLSKFRRLLGKASEQDRRIILLMAQKMALR